MYISKQKLEKLASILTSKVSCFDFFQALYLNYDENSAGCLLHTFDDGRVNVVIQGGVFDDEFFEWLLTLPNIANYFKDIKELRFVGSRVSIPAAKSFKRLNDNMIIYHVTYDDFMNILDEYNTDPGHAKSDMDIFNISPI